MFEEVMYTNEDGGPMLTTIDNPHNPRTDYDKWSQWDKDNGYNTEAFIARLVMNEEGFDIDDELGLNGIMAKVIQDVLEHDVINIYTLA